MPLFSLQALFDGSYFDQIDLWFSDTFLFAIHSSPATAI
ncbi:MAG: DHHW family protein [Anaeromassilibacillus sp.]